MVSGSAWGGRLTVTQEKGNSESDGFNSRRDRKNLLISRCTSIGRRRALETRCWWFESTHLDFLNLGKKFPIVI